MLEGGSSWPASSSAGEQDGLIIYPTCRLGFHAVGCCICSPDCPLEMTDIGVSCQKQAHGRGVGSPLNCPANQDQIGGLCYGDCPAGWKKAGIQCEEIKETCEQVPNYDACVPGGPFCFRLTLHDEYCSTNQQPADTAEHAQKYFENCGYAATQISCSQSDACSCTIGSDSFQYTSGFTYCIEAKCQRCFAGKWSPASGCLGC